MSHKELESVLFFVFFFSGVVIIGFLFNAIAGTASEHTVTWAIRFLAVTVRNHGIHELLILRSLVWVRVWRSMSHRL